MSFAFRDSLIVAARASVGTVETTRNSGPTIDEWLAYVYQGPGAPWCVAWVAFMHKIAADSCGVPNPCPRTAGALRLWELAPRVCREPFPAPGDVFVLDTGEPGGAGHVGIVEWCAPNATIHTIEGNTNAQGSRNGDRVAEHTWNPLEEKRGKVLGYLCFHKMIQEPPITFPPHLPPSPFR